MKYFNFKRYKFSTIAKNFREFGYKVLKWRCLDRAAGSVCCVMKDDNTGFLLSAADPRRESYSVGW